MDTVYKTSDIVLAAYLKLSGYQMTRIDKMGAKGTFVFDSVSDAAIALYDLGNASVEPITFNNTIKQLTTSVRRLD